MEGIYSLIPREDMNSILKPLQSFTRLPIRLIDAFGNTLAVYGEEASYCALLNRTGLTGTVCATTHAKAGYHALRLGEAYIFSCHASLNHIAFPLIHQHELLATIIVGPFLMDTPDSTIVSSAAEKYELSPSTLLELYDELSGLVILPPARVNDLSKLLEHLFLPLMPAERVLLLDRQEKLYQQSKISETIQMYKNQSVTPQDKSFFEQERLLLTKAKTGDVIETKRILNEILGRVLFSEGGRLDRIQARALELTTLLSRVAVEGGAGSESMSRLTSRYFDRIKSSRTMEDLCFLLQEILESFMDAMFSGRDNGNPCIRSALQFIATNYNQHLSVADVAGHVNLSPNYFSELFRKLVGVSFVDYLNRVRVEESKQLLLSRQGSLSEIAIAVGFPDQSYFCKVFKRVTGITPGAFRG